MPKPRMKVKYFFLGKKKKKKKKNYLTKETMSYWWYLLSVMIYEFPQLRYKLTGPFIYSEHFENTEMVHRAEKLKTE